MSTRVLTVNVGSSSVKAAVFDDDLAPLAVADVSGIGSDGARRRLRQGDGPIESVVTPAPDPVTGLRETLGALTPWTGDLAVVVHRVVHGGPDHADPEWLTPGLVADLEALRPLAPDHLPASLDAMAFAAMMFPAVRQAACFDTAFHRHLPAIARIYPLPRRLLDAGIRRYGFHGLSSESAMEALAAADPVAASGRVVIAHLGNGASMTAVRDGRSVDTTMGFSPMGGLMMGTRSGDLDPGVLLYVLDREAPDSHALRRLVTGESGLLGVSARTRDMRELLALEPVNAHAREAVELFCYQARKALGALVAVLGGLDTLIFTGGIGEHAAPVRARIVSEPNPFGVRLDPERNHAHAAVLSVEDGPVVVRMLRSDEERVMARHACALLSR